DDGPAGARGGPGPARSVAGRRTTLRPGGQADGGERQLAVPAPRHRAVLGQAADADVAAGGVLHDHLGLARVVPAAIAAGGPGHAVVRAGPGRPPVDPAHRPLRLVGAAVRVPVHLAGEEGADRPAGDLLHHLGQLRPAAPPAAGPGLALVDPGLVLRRH